MDIVRTWLIDSELPTRFWGELYVHAVYVYNYRPHSRIGNKTPASLLFPEGDRCQVPNLKFLYPIGCKVTMHIVSELQDGKFGDRSLPGWYVGTSDTHPGVHMWSDKTHNVYASSHVKVFPKILFKENKGNSIDNSLYEEFVVEVTENFTEQCDEFQEPLEIIDELVDSSGEVKYRTRWSENSTEEADTLESFNSLRETDAIVNWENPSNENKFVFATKTNKEDYPTLQEAMRRADKNLWIDAMQEEYDSLMSQGTWTIVERCEKVGGLSL